MCGGFRRAKKTSTSMTMNEEMFGGCFKVAKRTRIMIWRRWWLFESIIWINNINIIMMTRTWTTTTIPRAIKNLILMLICFDNDSKSRRASFLTSSILRLLKKGASKRGRERERKAKQVKEWKTSSSSSTSSQAKRLEWTNERTRQRTIIHNFFYLRFRSSDDDDE